MNATGETESLPLFLFMVKGPATEGSASKISVKIS